MVQSTGEEFLREGQRRRAVRWKIGIEDLSGVEGKQKSSQVETMNGRVLLDRTREMKQSGEEEELS